MKKFWVLFFVAVVLVYAGVSQARQVELATEVQYEPPYPQYEPTGWRLYMDDVQVCTVATIVDGVMLCPPFEAAPGNHDFTTTVIYQDGVTESPKSPIFPFFIPPVDLPFPVIIEMVLMINGEPVVMRGQINVPLLPIN